MTKFFITRPIFASVLSIIIVLAGLAAAFKLPIAQYPQIAPPTVTITASYPGASADTLAKTVAGPIEEQLSGVDNLLYFNSSADSSGTLVMPGRSMRVRFGHEDENIVRVIRSSTMFLFLPARSSVISSIRLLTSVLKS